MQGFPGQGVLAQGVPATPWLNRPVPSSSRQRAVTFSLAFAVAAVAGLVWVYTQPPIYRAMARLQITPSAGVAPAADANHAPAVVTNARSFLTEVQILTSRPVLQDAIARVARDSRPPELGPDPVGAVQRMLHADPVEGTQIVQLSATGGDRQFVAPLVNAVTEAYRQHVADAFQGRAMITDSNVAAEAAALNNKVAAQRDALNAFSQRYDIVSMARQENDVLAEVDGLSKSYTAANERLAKAKGRLDALKTGKAAIRPKDDPTLAALQQRASLLREAWRDLQARFTPAYLALDPDAKSLQQQLDEVEQQLKSQAGAGDRTAVAEAQQEFVATQAAVDQLRNDVADNQKKAQEFATHLNEYKAMSDDLDQLEAMHRAAVDRLARLQASAQERAPQVEVLEAAVPSRQPWQPDYTKEAALAIGGSVVFGIFTTWLVGFITGPRQLAPVFVQYSWSPAMLGPDATIPPPLLGVADIPRLPSPEPPARELADAEIAVLLASATEEVRLLAAGLLTGLDADELIALRWDDVDLDAGVLRIDGDAPRTLVLDQPLRSLLAAQRPHQPEDAVSVLRRADGSPLTREEIARLILFAAYDAGLDRPQEVTADALRCTYLSFLLRQGIRAADLEKIAGSVPQTDLVALMQLHSPAIRRPLDDIERVLPALRDIAAGGIA